MDIPDESAAVLRLSRVGGVDGGRYRVWVSNDAGMVVSDVVMVTDVKQVSKLTVSAPLSSTYGKVVTDKVAWKVQAMYVKSANFTTNIKTITIKVAK